MTHLFGVKYNEHFDDMMVKMIFLTFFINYSAIIKFDSMHLTACAYDLGREFHASDFQIDARLAQQNSFTKWVAVIPFGLLLSNLIIAL